MKAHLQDLNYDMLPHGNLLSQCKGIGLGGWRGRGDELRYQGDSQAEYEFSFIFSHFFLLYWYNYDLYLYSRIKTVDFYPFFLNTMGEITTKHYKSGPLYQEDKSRISKSLH